MCLPITYPLSASFPAHRLDIRARKVWVTLSVWVCDCKWICLLSEFWGETFTFGQQGHFLLILRPMEEQHLEVTEASREKIYYSSSQKNHTLVWVLVFVWASVFPIFLRSIQSMPPHRNSPEDDPMSAPLLEQLEQVLCFLWHSFPPLLQEVTTSARSWCALPVEQSFL